MPSLALPGEARCKRLVLRALRGSDACPACHGRVSFRREYGWCKACRAKVRPKAATWFRGSKLTYRQVFQLVYCWQERCSPGTACLVTGLSYTTIHRWYWRFRSLVPKDNVQDMLSGIV